MNDTTNLMEASEQWRDRPADQRFETLGDLRSAVHSRRNLSRSVEVDTGSLSVHDNGKTLVLNSALAECEPTHWSFGQLATQIKAPAAYLRRLPRPLLVENLQHGLKTTERETVKFLTTAEPDGGIGKLQAVTSTTYGRIWDADVVDAVQRIVDKSGGRFFNPKAYAPGGEIKPQGLYASDHDVFVFMIDGGSLLDAGPRAKVNRGFFVWNSETGARSFGLKTFLFNVVCGNHICWGATDITETIIRHSSGGPARFDAQAVPALSEYVNASEEPVVTALKKAQDYLLPKSGGDLTAEVFGFANKHGSFSKSEISEAVRYAKAEEGDCRTLWQLVQGLTAYARGFDFVDAKVDLENRAGKLLDPAK